MTPYDLTELLELDDESDQQTWLSQHAPTRDDALIAALEAEIQRRARTNPKTSFSITKIISLAASLWSEPEILADSLYLEGE